MFGEIRRWRRRDDGVQRSVGHLMTCLSIPVYTHCTILECSTFPLPSDGHRVRDLLVVVSSIRACYGNEKIESQIT